MRGTLTDEGWNKLRETAVGGDADWGSGGGVRGGGGLSCHYRVALE